MEYKDIEKVNAEIKTVPIKGKNYAEVKERIKAFRKLYPEGFIRTSLISEKDGVCIFKAEVGYFTETHEPIILATGTAREDIKGSTINKTSFIENCETSAIGRALGILGIGIDTAIASAEEMSKTEQESKPEPVGIPMPTAITGLEIANIRAEMERTGIYEKTILDNMGMKTIDELTPALYVAIMTKFRDTPDKKE